MTCSWVVYNMFITCSGCGHYLLMTFSLFIIIPWYELFTISQWFVHGLFTNCSYSWIMACPGMNSHNLFTTSSWLAHEFFNICFWLVNDLVVLRLGWHFFVICYWLFSQLAYGLIMACSWLIHYLLMPCSWVFHVLLMTNFLFVYRLFIP